MSLKMNKVTRESSKERGIHSGSVRIIKKVWYIPLPLSLRRP